MPKMPGRNDRWRCVWQLEDCKPGDLVGDRMDAFYCMDCGYIEFYKEASTKEPKRWRSLYPEPVQEPTSEKPQKPKNRKNEKSPNRKLRKN